MIFKLLTLYVMVILRLSNHMIVILLLSEETFGVHFLNLVYYLKKNVF